MDNSSLQHPRLSTSNEPAISSGLMAVTSFDQSPSSYPDAGSYLRESLRIPPDLPVNLSSIPDPPPGRKPDVLLASLVELAIYGSPMKRLTLQEIYLEIEKRFEYYRTCDPKWKSSIRHMLSFKAIFVSTPRHIADPGRGSYWQLDVTQATKHKRARKRANRRASTSNTSPPATSTSYSSPTEPALDESSRRAEREPGTSHDDIKVDSRWFLPSSLSPPGFAGTSGSGWSALDIPPLDWAFNDTVFLPHTCPSSTEPTEMHSVQRSRWSPSAGTLGTFYYPPEN